MNALRLASLQFALGSITLALSFVAPATKAQEQPAVTQVTPNVLVFATASGNVVASVGPDGALLVGTPSAASTPAIEQVLKQRTKSPTRYVVIFPESPSESEGDAGWGRLGAFVAMQENALRRIGGDQMGTSGSLLERLTKLGVDRPASLSITCLRSISTATRSTSSTRIPADIATPTQSRIFTSPTWFT